MALTLNSAFGGIYGKNVTLRSVVTERSPSVETNTSIVNVSIYLVTNAYASFNNLSSLLKINLGSAGGLQQRSVTYTVGTNSTVLIHAEDFTVTHDDSGAKSFQYTAELDINTSGYTFSAHTSSMTLTTIARTSTFSVSNGTLGKAIPIAIDRKDKSFTHDITYSYGSLNGTIATGVGISCDWTPPVSLATAFPNSTSGSCVITVTTMSGSTQIGTTSSTINLAIPDTLIPTVSSLILKETVSAVSGYTTGTRFIQTLSKPKVTLSGASGIHGSTIASYKIEVVGQNNIITTNGGILDYFKNSGTFTVRGTVTDSRGRTSSPVDISVTVLSYSMPTGSFTATRSGSKKNYVTVVRNAQVSPLIIDGVQRNKLKIQFSFAERGSTNYINSSGNANENLTSTYQLLNSSAVLLETFSTSKSYDIIMTVSDNFFPITVKNSIGTEQFPFVAGADRVGLGKIPEIANSVDSAYPYYYNGEEIQNHQLSATDGTAILLTAGTNLDNVTKTGFYNGQRLVNKPSGTGASDWFYIRVTKHTNSAQFILQEALDFNGVVSAYRTRIAGTWSAWKYYALTTNQNLINVDWTSTGVSNCYYKRNGNTIFFRFDVTPSGTSAVSLGSIPANLIPTEMFFVAPAHAVVNDANGQIQVNTRAITLFPNRAVRYHSQLSWSI